MSGSSPIDHQDLQEARDTEKRKTHPALQPAGLRPGPGGDLSFSRLPVFRRSPSLVRIAVAELAVPCRRSWQHQREEKMRWRRIRRTS